MKNNILSHHYRSRANPEDLKSIDIKLKESNLRLWSPVDLTSPALASLKKVRRTIQSYIKKDPLFRRSLLPYLPPLGVPKIISKMATAAAHCALGPMSTVAGAVAEEVGKSLLPYTEEIIVENGGDIYLHSLQERLIEIYPGPGHLLVGKLKIKVPPSPKGIGIAASSGCWGRSLSFGNSSVTVVLGSDSIQVDAAATALANRIISKDDLLELNIGTSILRLSEVTGYLVVADDIVQIKGAVELVSRYN